MPQEGTGSFVVEEHMLNRFSLVKKIAGGFVIILILLILLAVAGRMGLTRVVGRVDTSNQFQELVTLVLETRQIEKQFILTNDPDARDRVQKDISRLGKQVETILAGTDDREAAEGLERISTGLAAYGKAFERYVEMAAQKDALMAEMNQKASAALDITSKIRDDQKTQYDTLIEESETKISSMRMRVAVAGRIFENFLQAKGYRMVITEGGKNASMMIQWEGHHTDIERDLKKIEPFMTEEISKKRHATLSAAQKDLKAKALIYFKENTQENNIALISAAKAMQMATLSFQQEMQEQLEFYIEDVQIFSGQMMALSSGADQVAKILLNTRILEKEFIRTEDDAVFKRILDNIRKIDHAISGVKDSIDDEEKTKPLDGIKEAANNYISSFQSYADLMRQQEDVKTSMEKDAREIQAICLSAKTKVNGQMKRQISSSTAVMTGVSLAAVILGILIALFLARIIIRPIRQVVAALKDISEGDGDLTQRIDISTQDEIGELAKGFNTFISKLNNIIVQIGVNSETVSASSGELLSISGMMAEDSEGLTGRSNSVATAAEEMSASMTSVAATSEQAATNLTSVADAAGQMKTTLQEVAVNCDKARIVTENAAVKVKTATGRVVELGSSAQAISKVTEVITDIAEQTNLLALNATIEAARAGEAGKGFAVVAAEIKGLASQTAEATLDIKDKVQGIQNSTRDTVQEVEQITRVISEVTEIVSVIAAAIEEQSASASEVAENIEQASAGIGNVNENVAQSSQVSAEIAEDISKVNGVSAEMTRRSNRMRQSAEELSELSTRLRDMIGVFRVSMDDADLDESSQLSEREIEDLMPWGRKLELGIPDVDEQHRELVAMINELHRAMKTRKGAQEAGVVLKRLTDYTVYHFGFEEELFDTHGYPDTGAHKGIHKNLVAKVVAFKDEFESGKAALSMDLMQFLKDWLNHHIMEIDKGYVPFLKEKLGL